MADKRYTIIKLAPNVSSWCDRENNIYLSRPNKMSKRLKEGCDMKMIDKGVKAGLIFLEEHIEKQKQVVVPEEKQEPVQVVIPEDIEPEAKKAPTRRRKKEVDEVKVEINVIEKDKEE